MRNNRMKLLGNRFWLNSNKKKSPYNKNRTTMEQTSLGDVGLSFDGGQLSETL